MTRLIKTLAALTLVLALAAAGPGALAQPIPSGYERTDLGISINRDALLKLLGEATLEEAAGQSLKSSDPQALAAIEAVVSALGKLRLTFVSGPQLNTFRLDTEQDLIFDVQALDDETGTQATITTSLLPGLGILVPSKALDEALAALPDMDTFIGNEGQGMAYAKAVENYFNTQVPGFEQADQGSFVIPEVGTFSRRISFDVDKQLILGLGTTLLDVLRGDQKTQEIITFYLSQAKAPAASPAAEDSAPRDAQELIAKAEQALAEAAAEENVLIGRQTIYETDDGRTRYAETLINELEARLPRMMLTMLHEDGGDGADQFHQLALIIVSPDGEIHGQAEPDWQMAAQRIKTGENKEDSMLIFSSETRLMDGGGDTITVTRLTLYSGHGPLTLSAGKIKNLAGAGEDGGMSLHLFDEEPLITIQYTRIPLGEGEVPALHATDSLTLVQAGDGIDETENEQLTQVLMAKGLPALLVNFVQALPDEVETIIGLFTANQELKLPGVE